MFSLISSRLVTRDVLRGTLVWFLFSCVNVLVLCSITATKTTLLHPGPVILVYTSATNEHRGERRKHKYKINLLTISMKVNYLFNRTLRN